MLKDFRYRVVRRDGLVGVYEVYFDESGKPATCVEQPFSPVVSTVEDLRHELGLILKALDEPLIDYEQIGEGSKADHE